MNVPQLPSLHLSKLSPSTPADVKDHFAIKEQQQTLCKVRLPAESSSGRYQEHDHDDAELGGSMRLLFYETKTSNVGKHEDTVHFKNMFLPHWCQ